MTALANLAMVDPSVRDVADYVFPTTLGQAQTYNRQTLKQTKRGLLTWLHDELDTSSPVSVDKQGFLNDYYDDEGWWALAWIKVYDLTGEPQYLDAASDLFDDMVTGWDTPCGGIWWDKKRTVRMNIHQHRIST